MSAFISIVAPDGAYLLTDAATYDDEGNVRKIASKVFTAKSVPVAITTRGHAMAGEFIARTLCDLADHVGAADLIDHLQTAIDQMSGTAEMVFRGGNVIQVLVAAYVPGRGGLHRAFATDEMVQNFGAAAFKVITPPDIFATGSPVTTELIFASGVPYKAPAEAIGDYTRRVGADIMEVMRRVPAGRLGKGDGDQFYGIGGRCDLAAITAAGVKTDVLRVWDDKIGRPIDPFAPAATVRHIGPNRAERRRIKVAQG